MRRTPGILSLPGYLSAPAGKTYDLRSEDDRVVLKFKIGRGIGARELHASMADLAVALSDDLQGLHNFACLVWHGKGMSWPRAQWEWKRLLVALKEPIRLRMALLWVPDEGPIQILPENPTLEQLARLIHASPLRRRPPSEPRPFAISSAFFEVFKVLLVWHLKGSGPLSLGLLCKLTGRSHPTVSAALAELRLRGELRRNSNRSVELTSFPRRTWGEVLALSTQLRTPLRFIDPSGRPPNPMFLLSRVRRLSPPGIALGGTLAAETWHPRFNLAGLPRLDLSLHLPGGDFDPETIARIDPTLQRARGGPEDVVLVVHPLRRAEALFTESVGGALPVADLVETLLDLHEMHLESQSWEMVNALQRRKAQ